MLVFGVFVNYYLATFQKNNRLHATYLKRCLASAAAG